MSKDICRKCGKAVYFAERKRSIGHYWHPHCLRCEECGKVLNPGQHAEHKGKPFCHIPCYSALFGPTMFGHGSSVEAHKSFGKKEDKKDEKIRSELLAKINAYNAKSGDKVTQLTVKEVNDRLVMDGLLRVHWGVKKPIQLKDHDNVPVPTALRRSYLQPNGVKDADSTEEPQTLLETQEVSYDDGSYVNKDGVRMRRKRVSYDDSDVSKSDSSRKIERGKFNTVAYRGFKRKKRYSINGHIYKQETSVFTPPYGTPTSVRVTSLIPTPDVIKLMLDKFRVVNNPDEFSLYCVKDNGETMRIEDSESPLVSRLMLGPDDKQAKIFIMEKSTETISQEVAQYLNLPETVLKGFLEKFREEEEREISKIKTRYEKYKEALQKLLKGNHTRL